MNARPSHLNVFVVEEFETASGKTARSWTKIGAAFPHADGVGFNLELKALPLDGKLVVRPRAESAPSARKGRAPPVKRGHLYDANAHPLPRGRKAPRPCALGRPESSVYARSV